MTEPRTRKDNPQKVLLFLESFIDVNGYAPSNQQIAEAVGITRRAVSARLAALQNEGRITIEPIEPVNRVITVHAGLAAPRQRATPKPAPKPPPANPHDELVEEAARRLSNFMPPDTPDAITRQIAEKVAQAVERNRARTSQIGDS